MRAWHCLHACVRACVYMNFPFRLQFHSCLWDVHRLCCTLQQNRFVRDIIDFTLNRKANLYSVWVVLFSVFLFVVVVVVVSFLVLLSILCYLLWLSFSNAMLFGIAIRFWLFAFHITTYVYVGKIYTNLSRNMSWNIVYNFADGGSIHLHSNISLETETHKRKCRRQQMNSTHERKLHRFVSVLLNHHLS